MGVQLFTRFCNPPASVVYWHKVFQRVIFYMDKQLCCPCGNWVPTYKWNLMLKVNKLLKWILVYTFAIHDQSFFLIYKDKVLLVHSQMHVQLHLFNAYTWMNVWSQPLIHSHRESKKASSIPPDACKAFTKPCHKNLAAILTRNVLMPCTYFQDCIVHVL